MPVRAQVDPLKFNQNIRLPFELRTMDFHATMQDVYDFFYDVNMFFARKKLPRLDDELRPAIMSGMLSDMITASLAKHSRTLTPNLYHNGHPDLILKGEFANNKARSGGLKGIEIKTTKKSAGSVDTHGGRDQYMCVFVYKIDSITEPARQRAPLRFTKIYINQVSEADFRDNDRSKLGTRTSTLDKEAMSELRSKWIYKL